MLERLTLDFGPARVAAGEEMRRSDFGVGFHYYDPPGRRKVFPAWSPPNTTGPSLVTRCRAACPSWTSCLTAGHCAAPAP